MNANEAAIRQYRAELTMLRKAIEACPDELWLSGSPNRTWHIAYHALFYTHFYLSPSDAAFVSWKHHRPDYNYLGEIPFKPGYRPQIDQPYRQAELLAYLDFCFEEVEKQLTGLDLEAPSGFSWLPMTKLELQFYNVRHLGHHSGQIIDRLRSHAGIGTGWVR